MTTAHNRFSYERLHVHEDILQFLAGTNELATTWDNVHAVVDHLDRASESILVNLAEGCRAHALRAKQTAIDYSLGSVLECAACLDIAEAKRLITDQQLHHHKQELDTIFGKLVGLRKSWERAMVCEEEPPYGEDRNKQAFVFRHERLDAYQLAVRVVRDLASIRLMDRLPRGAFRRIDEVATGVVLNIAEGNGRFAHLDHRRFLEIANRSTTKLAVRLDVCVARGHLERGEVEAVKEVLRRVDATTAALRGRWGMGE